MTNYIFALINRIIFEITPSYLGNRNTINEPLLNFFKLYRLIVVPFVNADTHDILIDIFRDVNYDWQVISNLE